MLATDGVFDQLDEEGGIVALTGESALPDSSLFEALRQRLECSRKIIRRVFQLRRLQRQLPGLRICSAAAN